MQDGYDAGKCEPHADQSSIMKWIIPFPAESKNSTSSSLPLNTARWRPPKCCSLLNRRLILVCEDNQCLLHTTSNKLLKIIQLPSLYSWGIFMGTVDFLPLLSKPFQLNQIIYEIKLRSSELIRNVEKADCFPIAPSSI